MKLTPFILFAFLVVCLEAHASPGSAVEIDCGGKFGPKANASGSSKNTTLKRANGTPMRLESNPGVLELIPTNPALAQTFASYQAFCPSNDAALNKQCRGESQQTAVDAAIEECKKAALANGNNDALYRCKRESCQAGDPGCQKLATDSECTVPVPRLQCKCEVAKQFDQPSQYQSTVSCGCSCTCEASGSADFQCTNCDGSCVKEQLSFCGEFDLPFGDDRDLPFGD